MTTNAYRTAHSEAPRCSCGAAGAFSGSCPPDWNCPENMALVEPEALNGVSSMPIPTPHSLVNVSALGLRGVEVVALVPSRVAGGETRVRVRWYEAALGNAVREANFLLQDVEVVAQTVVDGVAA